MGRSQYDLDAMNTPEPCQTQRVSWAASALDLRDGMIEYHTMAKSKVAITLDSTLLERLDELVAEQRFPNRSQAIELALVDKLERLKRGRLARETAKLDLAEEQALADEDLGDRSWPTY